MDCESVREDLMDVLYGEASPAAAARVAEHVAACPSCRDEQQGLRRTRRDLQEWRLPPSLAARPGYARARLGQAMVLASDRDVAGAMRLVEEVLAAEVGPRLPRERIATPLR